MKKRMLITTIVMVLVVAIALTTSSLAWFTMSAQVSITEVSFGAVVADGAQLSVAGLTRIGWGASASIGTGVTFDPSQGNPMEDSFTLTEDATGIYSKPTISGFQAADDVTATAAGNQTANQIVTLKNATSAVFIGGFNVRNDGYYTDATHTGAASVTISAELNVGEAHLVNPTGDSNTADDFYVYGDIIDGHANIATFSIVDAGSYYTCSTSASVTDIQAAFSANQKDLALAGGLRVAVFTRTWEWTVAENEFDDDALNRVGVYGFNNYKVSWTESGWFSEKAASSTNALYVLTPDTGAYSMNPILAEDAAHYVHTSNVDGGAETMGNYGVEGLNTDTIPTMESIALAGEVDGVRSGIEVIVVVWMDGWDNESVPAAGGGLVSLAYSVTSVSA